MEQGEGAKLVSEAHKGAAVGGMIASIVDIGAASLINLVSPIIILHAIARGLIGLPAMTGGSKTALLGLALQILMGAIIGGIFGFAANHIPTLTRRWLLAGLAYGIGVFVVMEFVVVPLSAYAKMPHFTAVSLIENLIAMMLFGSIISYFSRRFATPAI